MKADKLIPPPGWGDDSITEIFDIARHNNYATFHNVKKGFKHLIEINDIFASTIKYSENSREYPSLLFLLKTQSAFLGAVRLATACQVPEAYMVLRGVLENALYGWYIHKNRDLFEIWLRRHEKESYKKQVQEKFRLRAILDSFNINNAKLGSIANKLYDRCIDYGAHPNEGSLSQNLRVIETKEKIEFRLDYFAEKKDVIGLCLKTSAQIGALCLKIFELIIPERFEITQLDKRLDKALRGL